MSLEKITNDLKSRIGAHSPIQAVIKFDFGADGIVRIDGKSSPSVIDNENGPADCTVKVTMAHFVDIAEGNLNPQMAFMTGKLKVEGNMALAMQLGSLLG